MIQKILGNIILYNNSNKFLGHDNLAYEEGVNWTWQLNCRFNPIVERSNPPR